MDILILKGQGALAGSCQYIGHPGPAGPPGQRGSRGQPAPTAPPYVESTGTPGSVSPPGCKS